MKKFKEFLGKPITWGGYGKLCIISMLLSVVYVVIYMAYLMGWFGELKEKVVNLFVKKKDEAKEE